MKITHCKLSKKIQRRLLEFFTAEVTARTAAYLFNNLNEVNMLTEDWIKVYNNERPHDSLNDMTPAEYRQVA
ncbi:transposase [Psychrobacter sp. PSP]|uniref:transposase n=1 Tax=Psychrobacter sp. PSP TaxID=2734636 RepID=UPI002094D0B3|nr:transposase [Psychrobacter sp. PSP]